MKQLSGSTRFVESMLSGSGKAKLAWSTAVSSSGMDAVSYASAVDRDGVRRSDGHPATTAAQQHSRQRGSKSES